MAQMITTKRGRQVKLLTPAEWHERMYVQHGIGSGMAAFEQMVWQSRSHRVCIDCLAPNNLVECKNQLLPTDGFHSKDYWMCQECLDYYNNKG